MTINTALVDAIATKAKDEVNAKHCIPCLMTFEDVYKLLNDDEMELIKDLLTQKPSAYGVLEPFLGMEAVPTDVVAIKNQSVKYDGKTAAIPTQYVPRIVYKAYARLHQAYKASSGKNILIGSGYRSPANQAVNFLTWLQYYDYDFKKTLGYV
jgi:hypothetical protein